MEDENYYGLGSTENGNYKTLDNGLTWYLVTLDGDTEINGANGRIFLSSQEGKGFSYSDDGCETTNPSNIATGKWSNLIYSADKKFAFASGDDGSIARTADDGETWEIIYSGDSQIKFTSSWLDSDNNVCFGGNNGGFNTYSSNLSSGSGSGSGNDNNNGSLVNLGLVNTSNGNFSTYSFENGERSIIPVLNRIVAPKMYYETTGRIFAKDIGSIDTLLKESKTLYVSPTECLNEVIDWENDVGMRPFSTNLNDLASNEDNIAISTSFYNDDTKKMKQTIAKVRKYIEYRKRIILQNSADRLSAITTDTINIIETDTTNEEKLNALEIQNLYTDVQKYGALSVLGTAFNRIFLTSDVFIRKLIYAGIYEELVAIAGNLNNQLQKIYEKNLGNDEITVTTSDFVIRYNLGRGIKTAFNKYLKGVSSIIRSVNDLNDKDYISEAATYYNSVKASLIDQCYEIIMNTTPNSLTEPDLTKGETFDCTKYVLNLYRSFISNFNGSLSLVFTYPENISDDIYTAKKILEYLNVIYKKFQTRIIDYSDYVFTTYLPDFIANTNTLINNKAKKYFSEKSTNYQPDYSVIRKGFLMTYRSIWYNNEGLI